MDDKIGPYTTLAHVTGIHKSIIALNLNTGTHVILRMYWEIAGDPIFHLVIWLVQILFVVNHLHD